MTPGHQPWPYNPLIVLIRQHSTDIIADAITGYEAKHGFKASPFDLVIQTMIVACSYKPEEIWLSSGNDVVVTRELIEKDAVDMASEVFLAGIENGAITLNRELIASIAAHQLARLHKLHKAHQKAMKLPSYGDRALSAFGPDAELHKFRLTGDRNGDEPLEAVAIEKVSKDKVIFRQLDLKLSSAYIETFHYLHSVRDDDALAFGAFAEGEEMPFAVVTYAPVGRKYKQRMLQAAGINLKSTIELTRAWNCEHSPKNTMSLLYAYAHANVQRLFLHDRKQTLTVVTAVNPNLGFKGSAFRAVGFGTIGHKPTAFHYIVDVFDKRSFATRRDLTKMMDGDRSRGMSYLTALFPLLPTKELAVHLRGSQRERHIGTVYDVDDSEYMREVPLAT